MQAADKGWSHFECELQTVSMGECRVHNTMSLLHTIRTQYIEQLLLCWSFLRNLPQDTKKDTQKIPSLLRGNFVEISMETEHSRLDKISSVFARVVDARIRPTRLLAFEDGTAVFGNGRELISVQLQEVGEVIMQTNTCCIEVYHHIACCRVARMLPAVCWIPGQTSGEQHPCKSPSSRVNQLCIAAQSNRSRKYPLSAQAWLVRYSCS